MSREKISPPFFYLPLLLFPLLVPNFQEERKRERKRNWLSEGTYFVACVLSAQHGAGRKSPISRQGPGYSAPASANVTTQQLFFPLTRPSFLRCPLSLSSGLQLSIPCPLLKRSGPPTAPSCTTLPAARSPLRWLFFSACSFYPPSFPAAISPPLAHGLRTSPVLFQFRAPPSDSQQQKSRERPESQAPRAQTPSHLAQTPPATPAHPPEGTAKCPPEDRKPGHKAGQDASRRMLDTGHV